MKTTIITQDLPYFAATADCDWRAARRIARESYAGVERQRHYEAIDAAEVLAFVEGHTDEATQSRRENAVVRI